MIVRRSLADSNAGLAGAVPVASFARFKASIAMLSESTPSRPFGRWDLVSMVETQDIVGGAVCGLEEESRGGSI